MALSKSRTGKVREARTRKAEGEPGLAGRRGSLRSRSHTTCITVTLPPVPRHLTNHMSP